MSALGPSSISLARRDLTSSSATARRCLLVYPPTSKKTKQRIAVADSTGTILVSSIGKRLECVPVFSTSAASKAAAAAAAASGQASDAAAAELMNDSDSKPVNCATLYSDQLFCMRGSILTAYSRKGKQFFSTDTNVTESLHTLFVDTPYFFVAGDFMLTAFEETKELGFYMSPDRIHDVGVYVTQASIKQPSRGFEDYICCLGCNDRALRLVQGNKLMDEIGCEAAITSIYVDPVGRRLFYGTQAGTIGSFVIQVSNNKLKRSGGFTELKGGGGSTSSGITCLSLFDVNADGAPELLVGCEDGTVHIMHIGDGGVLEPIWTTNVGERVMTVAGGIVTDTEEHPDLLVHLNSGSVLSFTLKQEDNAAVSAAADAAAHHAEQRAALVAKKEDTLGEIAQLEEKIIKKSKQLAKQTGASAKKTTLVAVASTFKANVTLRPVGDSAALSLVIDADVALECAVLRGSTALTVIGTETTQLLPQTLHHSTNPRTEVLALMKPLQERQDGMGSRRLEAHLWADEGYTDTISVTLYALQEPRTAQVKSVMLCALPLYERVNSFDRWIGAEEVETVLSHICFRTDDMRDKLSMWLGHLLPGMSDYHVGDDEAPSSSPPTTTTSLFFACESAGSVLRIDHDDASVTFTSDSVIALEAVKRFVTTHAARNNISLSVTEDILFASVLRRLDAMEPAMLQCAEAARSAQLLEGLCELQSNDADLGYLPKHMKDILAAPDAVRAQAAAQKQQEVLLKRSAVLLYESLVRFKNHAPLLSTSLRAELESLSCGRTYSREQLLRFFFPNEDHMRERMLRTVAAMTAHAAAAHANATVSAPAWEESTLSPLPSISDVSERDIPSDAEAD